MARQDTHRSNQGTILSRLLLLAGLVRYHSSVLVLRRSAKPFNSCELPSKSMRTHVSQRRLSSNIISPEIVSCSLNAQRWAGVPSWGQGMVFQSAAAFVFALATALCAAPLQLQLIYRGFMCFRGNAGRHGLCIRRTMPCASLSYHIDPMITRTCVCCRMIGEERALRQQETSVAKQVVQFP